MAYLEYNAKHQPVEMRLDKTLIGQGKNLDLKRLYVLTSSQTASASEMVMNCLAPYMEVIQIGTTTVGKNMGARSFDNEEQMVTMTPMICKIYNALNESDYAKGFSPTSPALKIDENNYLGHFLPLGDPNETLLSTALATIAGESKSEPTTRQLTNHSITPLATSLSRRATAVLLK